MNVWRHLLPAVALTVLFCLPVVAQESDSGVLPSPTAACRKIGSEMRSRFPEICRTRTHWVLGVDISGSMAGDRLHTAKAILRDWSTYLLVPGDRVDLIVFDDQVRRAGTWTIEEDRALFLTKLMDPLSIRPGRRGSALQQARDRVLEVAARETQHESGETAVTLVLTDRDDPDGIPLTDGFSRGLVRQYGRSLAARQGDADAAAVEGETQLAVVPQSASSPVYLVALYAGSRVAPTAGSGTPLAASRRLPLTRSYERRTEYPDPYSGVRDVVGWSPCAVLLLALLLGWWLWKRPAGLLVNDKLGRSLPLPWAAWGRKSQSIQASRNAFGFRMEPVPSRPGSTDPLVLHAELENPWAPSGWRAVLKAAEGHEVQADQEGWAETVTVSPGLQHLVEVRDIRGMVATAEISFKPDRGARLGYQALLILLVLGLLLLVSAPMVNASFPPPPAPSVESVTSEALCS